VSSATGASAETAARLLNVALAPAIVVLMALLAAEAGRGLRVSIGTAAGWAAVLGAVNCATLRPEAFTLSEPLFMALVLASLLALCRALEREGRNAAWLIAASAAASLATLTRYVGVALIGTVCLATLLYFPRRLSRRFGYAVLAGLVATAGSAAWALRNSLVAGTTAAHELSVNRIPLERLSEGARTMLGFVVPSEMGGLRWPLYVIVIVGGATLCALAYRRARGHWERINNAQKALIVWLLVYPLFLAFAMSTVDAWIVFDWRLLAPEFVALPAVVSVILGQLAARPETRRIAYGWQAWAAACLVGQIVWTGTWSSEVRSSKVGLASVHREYPALFGAIQALPSGATVYTNWPHVIQYFIGRSSLGLPLLPSSQTPRPNPHLGDELADIGRHARSGVAYLVIFDDARSHATADEPYLAQYVLIDSLRSMPGGHIARLRPRPPTS